MKRKIVVLSIGAVFLVCASALFAEDRLVPSVYPTIQAGIDDCNNGDVVIVEPNTYTGTGNRDIDFLGKAITVRSIDPNDPDIVAATIIDCNGSEAEPHRGFKFHSGEGQNSVMAGLTITNGHAPVEVVFQSWERSSGGAILCSDSGPTIRHCRITNNWAGTNGGGICCYGDSTPAIQGCTIASNVSGKGGGMYFESLFWEAATVSGCTIRDNTATYRGGGICCILSALTVNNCTIENNHGSDGGGMSSYGFPTVGNSMFIGNTADMGGAVYIWKEDMTFRNCTFSGNAANKGGGIHCFGGASVYTCTCTIYNCVLWGDSASVGNEIYLFSLFGPREVVVSYSDVEGGEAAVYVAENDCELIWGDGNIDEDPCFVDPCNGDYHLAEDSPCISAGDPCYVCEPCETDIDGDARVLEGRVDMGADEVMSTPVINISVGEFEFYGHEGSGNPEGQVLTIRNSGGGTLNWTVSPDCNWLTAEPNSGSCNSGEANDITLSVDISSLSQGIYDCTLLVSDPNAVNNPQAVDVALRVFMGVIDYGDAPEEGTNYATTLARDGARHYLDFVNGPTVFLGEIIDEELDGQPSAGADGDDANYLPDEDGALFSTDLVPGRLVEVEVTASCAGKLDAWIDLNADGDWADANEQIFASEPLTGGSNMLTFGVPWDANLGQTYARFRFSTAGGLYYSGVAEDGEVEDYVVSITEECMRNTAPEYADWVALGKPDCWCYRKQCRGDVDGLSLGPLPVNINDLILFRLTIGQMVLPPGGICSDLDHQALGPLRISINDLIILRQYINQMDVPCCDNDGDCILDSSDKYNFWTEP